MSAVAARGEARKGRLSAGNQTVPGTQSIGRASLILREVASAGQNGMRLSELVAGTGIQHATAHRIVKSLVVENWLERDNVTKRYILGPLVFELGLCMPVRADFRRIVQPVLAKLARDCNETVYLNVRSGLDFVCVVREKGGLPIKPMVHDVGGRRPLGIGAGGIALLMEVEEKEAEQTIRKNSPRFRHYGQFTYDAALHTLRGSRSLGFVLLRDLDVAGLSAVSLPIHNVSRQPFAAITIVMDTARFSDERSRGIVQMLRGAIQTIERRLTEPQRWAWL